MVYTEPTETFVADTINNFCNQMCVSPTEILQELNNGMKNEVVEMYNDPIADEDRRVSSLDEIPDDEILEELKSYLGGDREGLFRDYLDQLEAEYTMVRTPSGWEKIILLQN